MGRCRWQTLKPKCTTTDPTLPKALKLKSNAALQLSVPASLMLLILQTLVAPVRGSNWGGCYCVSTRMDECARKMFKASLQPRQWYRFTPVATDAMHQSLTPLLASPECSFCRNFGISYASAQCAGCRGTLIWFFFFFFVFVLV
jgi:hypothetical protein